MKFSFLLLLFFSSYIQAQEKLRVATAANLKFPIEEVIKNFEKVEDVRVELITASSGVLFNQIINNAPFDIYLSANTLYPSKLVEKGYCGEVIDFAKGQLVFWSKKPFAQESIPKLIKELDQRTLAIAHESLAPFGVAAYQWLNTNTEDFDTKLVIGENIGQVNRYIYSGAVDAAFTSNSAMHSVQISGMGYWKIVSNSQPIDQSGCILTNRDANKASVIFTNYLLSSEGQSTLSKFGYLSGDATIE